MKNISVLKLARIIAQKTQHEVSRETGLSQTSISLIENGFREATKEEITTLTRCYGFSPEVLNQVGELSEYVGRRPIFR